MIPNPQLDAFVDTILRNLEKNGFPEKQVAFPLEKMYETASQKGFSFNKVRDVLKERGIETELTTERVIFRRLDLNAAAHDVMKNLSAEQRQNLTEMVQNLGPEEMQRIQQEWASMSMEEKLRLMQQMKHAFPS